MIGHHLFPLIAPLIGIVPHRPPLISSSVRYSHLYGMIIFNNQQKHVIPKSGILSLRMKQGREPIDSVLKTSPISARLLQSRDSDESASPQFQFIPLSTIVVLTESFVKGLPDQTGS